MGRKRKTRARDTFDCEEHPSWVPREEQRTRLEEHTTYEAGVAGDIHTSTSFVNVPLSPHKKGASRPIADEDTILEYSNLEDFFNGPEVGDKEESVEVDGSGREKKKRHYASDHPFLGFVDEVDTILDELLRLETISTPPLECEACGLTLDDDLQAFRCEDCFSSELYCRLCLVERHASSPYHSIHAWNGAFFERVTLKSLGLRVQLGHPPGTTCPVPARAFNDDFVVVSSDGIHCIGLDFCGCLGAPSHFVQLLRARLFPATTIDPKTAATFDVLKTFQMLCFTSKISALEYYKALARRSDNTGTLKIPDRYVPFLRMVHVWRHVRVLKRKGRGHDAGGSWGTAPAACAVLCPACPYPGINLPKGWERCRPEKRFIYQLFIALDANFRLKRQAVSSDENDPGLSHGYAYFVEERQFKHHLTIYNTLIEDDKSTCNNHDAIKSASIRGGRGTAASGIGTAQCSRHDMARPLGVCDLQKGERYVNMDYVFLSTLCFLAPLWVVVSHDIACQWSKNLADRLKKYPRHLTASVLQLAFVFLVPKFHLPAHVSECQTAYSFNFTKGVGRTDGECPERSFADTNKLASSTMQMGPGCRRDAYDDHAGDRNWKKTTQIAETLKDRALEALAKRSEMVTAFREFSAALEESPKGWTTLVKAWEADNSKPNPFSSPKTHLTPSAVRLKLAEEEEKAAKDGTLSSPHSELTPSVFIFQGIELEDGPTPPVVLQLSTAVQRRINAWISVQGSFMPQASAHRASKSGPNDPTEKVALYLPSSICGSITCDKRLIECEQRFRVAQAETALHDIRVVLMFRSQLWKSKKRYASGTRQHTRSNVVLDTLKVKLNRLAVKYRFLRAALVNLSLISGDVSWQDSLRVLADDDVKALTGDDEALGEGHRVLSWIWTTAGVGDSMEGFVATELRVEWCKTRARTHRWQEECMLLAEEMRRVLEFWKYEIKVWEKRAAACAEDPHFVTPGQTEFNTVPEIWQSEVDKLMVVRDGKVAYARRQISIRRRMLETAERLWGDIRERLVVFEGRSGFIPVEANADDEVVFEDNDEEQEEGGRVGG
ncbi:hypothetical protein CC1G_05880 [Coprinopsis cinerea okayama7|uniref:CxC2-like cysteine cluster KDZ transposase-associated domain-containing protein n=1 Tax=Coprinopsis cinerea (strain Okayama-7 / 130 / ATCC MYA-4618 / FGSC 9003) TaxID=240176 RepID=A8NAC9_COPC7|nr:hypothetical protein CC1G_05880 [Coprinopsis cinerea okayama7\|eukprot:XP_001831781.1 hypothetical protein CC1G_05880 [Coprinopsis cinerea okayama7\